MHRAQIQQALEAAREFSQCREFVIAGSLSVLGFLENPPAMMSMSIDCRGHNATLFGQVGTGVVSGSGITQREKA